MNHSAAFIHPRPVGYYAMVRLPMDAKARPIMDGDQPKRFDDAYSALRAATDRLEAFLNTNMRRDGETLLGARKQAQPAFRRAGT